MRPTAPRLLAMAAATLWLAGCDAPEDDAPAPIRPVRVAEVVQRSAGETVSLSGVIEAQTEAGFGFRIGGRVIERLVNVGDSIVAGQVLARLDAADEENGLRAARAALSAAEGQLVEAEANYERQAQLLERGFTTRQRYDQARQALQTARAQADSTAAQVEIAANRLADTQLLADAPGAVTAIGAEPGEVVTAGRMVARVARDDGRDAVFDAPAALVARAPRDPAVAVRLTIDPSVTAKGRVREVSPVADAATGAFRVRVGLDGPPEAMRLGSTVTGAITLAGAPGYVIPATALTRAEGRPAVWVVDVAAATVALRPVEVADFGPTEVVLSGGVQPGEVVVTAGVQALKPGQKVRLPGAGA